MRSKICALILVVLAAALVVVMAWTVASMLDAMVGRPWSTLLWGVAYCFGRRLLERSLERIFSWIFWIFGVEE